MFEKILDKVLARAIVWGRLHLTYPDGRTRRYGPGPSPVACVKITDAALIPRLLTNPQMALGEGYMAGALTFPSDIDLRHFLQIAVRSSQGQRLPLPMRLANRARIRAKGLMQWNTLAASRRRVAHHYDIPDEFYAMFMERDLQYTCAHYARPDMTLEEAQGAKMALIAAKLCLRPGMRVLDIGCGWGGLALYLARHHGVDVTGVTLSEVQLAAARARAEAEGLGDRVSFRLQDYRHVPDRFDRVVSVGMMEHVGLPQYQPYFDKIGEILTADGLALIHFIGRTSPPGVLSPWFQKYIFPGGYAPALSEVLPRLERSGLSLCDVEVWRGHYERTLRHWQERFRAEEDRVQEMFDARFVRMWWWYLMASEVSFTHMHHVVFQLQIARDPLTVPQTRAYLAPLLAGWPGGRAP